ncbi:hypothetical protein ACFLZB_00880 [Nanoarchaeota archaeon]
MGDEINITFETLYDLLRREKSKEELQVLEKTFYADVVTYLGEKLKLLDGRSNEDDLFSMGEKEKLETELRSIKKILKELYEKREKKMIEMALNRSRTGSNIIDTSALLDEEKSFYEEVVGLFDKFRVSILLNMFEGNTPVLEKSVVKEVEEKEEVEQKEETKEEETTEETKEEKPDLMKIRFTNAVPRFVGTDLEVHGPFDQGEETELPSAIARLLVEKNRAELLP